jgi:hypothetical protein
MRRLDQNFVDRHVRWLRKSPNNGGGNIVGVKPQIAIATALREFGAGIFICGTCRNFGVRVTRLNARDFDSAASTFFAQALAEAFNKELGSGVPAAR